MTEIRPYTGVRILDMTHRYGRYAGRLFADLGAEVIRVEPPGGLPDRQRTGPGAAERFAFVNASKRSIVLDLESAEGLAAFEALARTAAIIMVERDGPMFGALGTLKAMNPAAVLTAVSPYGLGGPLGDAPASDLTLQAAGGMAWMSGRPGEPPLRLPGGQAEMMASIYAATVSAIALVDAEASGRGHVIDVSVQEAIAHSLQNAVQVWDLERRIFSRGGEGTRDATEDIFPCSDGYVFLASPLSLGGSWRALVALMTERGHPAAEALAEERWSDRAWRTTAAAREEFRAAFTSFTAPYSKDELTREAIARRIVLGPIARIGELMNDEQLIYRDFFASVPRPDGTDAPFPGPPYRFSEEHWRVAPAPRARRRHRHHRRTGSWHRRERTPMNFLKGIRFADFTWAGAGPFSTKLFSDFGADVIKVESLTRLDPVRAGGPFKDGKPGVNRSGYFASRNTGKRSLALDLKKPADHAVALELIRSSDVVTSNFGPGAMERLGLSYDEVREVAPEIIYLQMPMYGADGPRANLLGVGMTISAATGLMWQTAYGPDDPVGPGTHYPDHAANCYHAAFAVLAALRQRRLTGKGTRIELAQVESTINFVGPSFLEWAWSGTEPAQIGNASQSAAPHGIFRAAGDDAWLAIAVETDAQWRSLAGIVGGEALADGAGLASAEARLLRRDEVEAIVSRWTATQPAEATAATLSAAGVPAAVVAHARRLIEEDPQLAARDYWQTVAHPEIGETIYNAPPYRIDGARVALKRPPLLGEHSDEIRAELGRTDDTAAHGLAKGAAR